MNIGLGDKMAINSLNDIIKVNDGFKNAINLYLNLNKTDKILSYIPTKSSVNILNEYIEGVLENKSQATVLIGPYGKGKSHLLLVLLSILSLDRNKDSDKIIKQLISSIKRVDEQVAEKVTKTWRNKRKFLPVIISNSYDDLNQAFLIGLNDAIKRAGLENIVPETYYSEALQTINNWKKNYSKTFDGFLERLKEKGISYKEFASDLSRYNKEKLDIFRDIYPDLTSGSQFNPMVSSEILPLYKGINDKLCDEYGYSGIYIIFDEFSKLIESRDKKAVGSEMKILQDICELAQESKHSQIFITLVTHKSIKEYGNYLSTDIINSFTGIEGRIEEKYFITSSKNNYELIQNAIIKNDSDLNSIEQLKGYFADDTIRAYYRIPAFSSMFEYEDFKNIIMKGCYPLNPISAYILLNISEKVAQNERTLFTFISKYEANSMAKFIKKHNSSMEWIVTADIVYDYFKNIFKKDISNKYVHDEWLKADYAISNAKNKEQVKLLKCLALINIINKNDELPAKIDILRKASGIHDIEVIANQLIQNQLLYIKGSTDCYVFKSSVGADLKNEIKKRRLIKGGKYNTSSVFSKISEMKFEAPKQYNQRNSMTRYFKYDFINYDTFMQVNDSASFFGDNEFCDGKIIILVCEENVTISEENIVKKLNGYADERIVVLKPSKTFKFIKLIQDYEVLQDLRNDSAFIDKNKVLLKELDIFEEEIVDEINQYIDEAYNLDNMCKAYYFSDTARCWNHPDVNKLISKICGNYYGKTPLINNELINKHFIKSAPIKKARKTIIEYVLSGKVYESFYSGTSPEATIYRAVFVRTNVLFGEPDENMNLVLKQFIDFMELCNEKRVLLDILISKLINAPFGMRKGVIPLYLAYILSQRSDDVIIYFGAKEVQLSADIVLNMCEHPKDYSMFVSAESIEKEKYIDDLQKIFDVAGNYNLSGSRLNNILVSMQRWFRGLPQITRNFKEHCELFENEVTYNAMIQIKPLLQKIDANPYEIIFEKIPKAFSEDKNLVIALEGIIELKTILDKYMEWLISTVVKETILVFDDKGREDLNHTLIEWYETQSKMSKQGLYGNKVTGLMNYIEGLNIYDDTEIVKRIIKIISETYVENWNDNSLKQYINELKIVKKEIELIKDETVSSSDKNEITFIDSKGNPVRKYYDRVSENTGNIFRNIIEDAIDDFSDLSVNDKTAILVEVLEKILK